MNKRMNEWMKRKKESLRKSLKSGIPFNTTGVSFLYQSIFSFSFFTSVFPTYSSDDRGKKEIVKNIQ